MLQRFVDHQALIDRDAARRRRRRHGAGSRRRCRFGGLKDGVRRWRRIGRRWIGRRRVRWRLERNRRYRGAGSLMRFSRAGAAVRRLGASESDGRPGAGIAGGRRNGAHRARGIVGGGRECGQQYGQGCDPPRTSQGHGLTLSSLRLVTVRCFHARDNPSSGLFFDAGMSPNPPRVAPKNNVCGVTLRIPRTRRTTASVSLVYPSDCQPSPIRDRLLRTGVGSTLAAGGGAAGGETGGGGGEGGETGGGETGGGEVGVTLGDTSRPKS